MAVRGREAGSAEAMDPGLRPLDSSPIQKNERPERIRRDRPESVVTECEVIEKESDAEVSGDLGQRRSPEAQKRRTVFSVRHQKRQRMCAS